MLQTGTPSSKLRPGLNAVISDCFPSLHACTVSCHTLSEHQSKLSNTSAPAATMHLRHTHTVQVCMEPPTTTFGLLYCPGATAVAVYQSSGASSSQSTSFASTSSAASANDDYFAASSAISQGLAELQLILGTAAPSSLSLYLEPAFFPRAGMGPVASARMMSP